MLRNILLKTLRDQRKSLFWWMIGGVIPIVVYVVISYPTVRDNPQYDELLEAYPQEMMDLLLAGAESFTSPTGYLQGSMFALIIPIIFLVFAIARGAAAIAGEEERKTLDLLLAHPVSRTSVLLQKFGAMLAAILLLGLVFWLMLVVGAGMVDMNIPAGNLAAAMIGVMNLGLLFGTLALAVGAITGNRGLAVGITGAAALGLYMLNGVGMNIEGLEEIRKISPFYLYIGNQPLESGVSLGFTAALLGPTILLLLLGLWRFNRRDIAV
jgi:ABC-2 type transport system permease protein